MRGLSGPPPSNAHYDKLAREREEARRVNGWEAAKNQEYDLFKQRGQLEGRLYDALESILHLLDISHASEEMLVDLGQELVDDERKPARQRARVARHLGIVHQLQGGLRNLEREWRGLKERTFAVDKHYTKLMNRYRAQLLGWGNWDSDNSIGSLEIKYRRPGSPDLGWYKRRIIVENHDD